MNNLALELIEYFKKESEQESDILILYKSIRDKLGNIEFNHLPDKYRDEQIVNEAWNICYARTGTYVTTEYCAESDIFPSYLAKAGVTPYDLYCDINNIIDEKIDSVFDIDDAEIIASDAIEEVIERSTLENAGKICNEYIEYMKEEYDQELEIWNNNGDPIIVHYDKHITWRANLDYDKIVEIAGTSGSDYFNIEVDWSLMN